MAVQGGGNAGTAAKKPAAAPQIVPNLAAAVQNAVTATNTGTAQSFDYTSTNQALDAAIAAEDSGGGGGADSGGSPATGNAGLPTIDWASLLGEYGLPSDIISELDRIFRQTGDINQAILLGQAYVRGTDWYASTFPGIQAGINAGLFSDERGYRQYQQQVDQVYQQYY